MKAKLITIASFFVLALTAAILAIALPTSTRLETPSGLTVTDDARLTWSQVDGATHYLVNANGTRHITTENSFDLLGTIKDYDRYKFTVAAMDSQSSQNDSFPSKPFNYDITLSGEIFEYETSKDGAYISIKDGIEQSAIPDLLIIPSLSPDGKPITRVNSFKNMVIKTVYIPDSVTQISINAFSGCESLKRVRLSQSLTTLSSYAFSGCANLEELVLPETLTSICFSAIDGCSSLSELRIPSKASPSSQSAFKDCTSLKNVTVDENNPYLSIENGCMLYKYTALESGVEGLVSKNYVALIKAFDGFTIPSDVNILYSYAFENLSLTKIELPHTIESAIGSVFYKCDDLEEVAIAEGFISFSSLAPAFYECKNLKKISLPSTLKQIYSNLFYKCDSLANISISSANTAYKADGTFILDKTGKTVICGTEAKNFPSTATTINTYAYSRSGITEAILPDTIIQIRPNAFFSCQELKTVKLSNNLDTISNGVFYYCTDLETVNIPNSVRLIAADAFYCCYKLSVTIPHTVNKINSDAFYGATVYADTTKTDCDWYNQIKILDSLFKYAFGGWVFTGTTLKSEEDGSASYVVSFTYLNDSDGSNLLEFAMPKEITANGYANRAVPYRAGYTFKGWATQENGEIVYAPFTCTPINTTPYLASLSDEELELLPSGTTLYAVWEKAA